MNDDLHNASELIEELEGLSLKTSQGSFVKMEDVRRLITKRTEARAVDDAQEPPKTMTQAKEQAKKFLGSQGFGQKDVPEPGRSISATEPQPSSRT